MIIRSAEFVKSALKPDHYPKSTLPEIAFAGRSNVGKSSLINTLVRRKALVRTSRTPGQTRTLNFFLINDTFMLVDLPGYGFSRASKEVIKSYQESIGTYLKTRSNLTLVVLLLDIRRIPSQEDKAFFQSIRVNGLEYLIVLTKSDTLGRGSWKKARKDIFTSLEDPPGEPLFFSAKTGQGREEIWAEIEGRLDR
ncbi:MAG: ribosome biogenesis GTP-binding protein YihA/YsxC [Candidatus Aquicultor sp.]